MNKKHVYVLGINAYDHDVSACLLRDGAIAFAISKERLTREKHDTGFYQGVVDYCLTAEGISLADVDLVVRNCYVLPVEDLETRMVSQDVPEVLSDAERSEAAKHPLYLSRSKKVWLKPVRGFLSDEFYYMPGLGALYSRVSSYIFADWNKCGEVMGLAPYGRPAAMKPLLDLKNGELSVPEWGVDFDKPWLL